MDKEAKEKALIKIVEDMCEEARKNTNYSTMEFVSQIFAVLPENDTTELKEWQVLAGKFASYANSMAIIVMSGKMTSNDHDRANEITDEVIEYLVFDEQD